MNNKSVPVQVGTQVCSDRGSDTAMQRGLFTQESQWHPLFFSVMPLYCQVLVEVMYN